MWKSSALRPLPSIRTYSADWTECLHREHKLGRKFGLGRTYENHDLKFPPFEQSQISGLHVLEIDEDVVVFQTRPFRVGLALCQKVFTRTHNRGLAWRDGSPALATQRTCERLREITQTDKL